MVLAALAVGAAVAAYSNSFSGVYFPDDINSIHNNPAIKQLWPVWDYFRSAAGGDVSGTTGRPLLNLSLGVNYALNGINPFGYHLLNLIVHLLSALLLFAVARRTMEREPFRGALGGNAPILAFAIALLWVLHPLQTGAVTFVIQRAESFMGCCVLLALYCAMRGFDSPSPVRWYSASVASVLFGMGFKEVAAVAPILILFYDHAFVAGGFKEAISRRRFFYLGLAATWGVFVVVLIGGGRLSATSSHTAPVAPMDYALTQTGVILQYIKLSVWPQPMVFHYWWPVAASPSEVLAPALLILLLFAGTVLAYIKKPWLGFLGAWFFLILAPSSSIIPIPREIAAEHRMYLPLIAVIVAVVVVGYLLLRDMVERNFFGKEIGSGIAWIILASVGGGFGLMTYDRNRDYQSEERMWRDVVAKHPENPSAYNNLGRILASSGNPDEALPCFTMAVQLQPRDPVPRNNLGSLLAQMGKDDAAIAQFQEALKLNPEQIDSLYLMGLTHANSGRYKESLPYLRKAYELDRRRYYILEILIRSLVSIEKVDEAIRYCTEALRADPKNGILWVALGDLSLLARDQRGAIEAFRRAIDAKPDHIEAMNRLALIWADCPDVTLRNPSEAIRLSQEVCKVTRYAVPEFLETLGAAYASSGDPEKAKAILTDAADIADKIGRKESAERIRARMERYKTDGTFKSPAPPRK